MHFRAPVAARAVRILCCTARSGQGRGLVNSDMAGDQGGQGDTTGAGPLTAAEIATFLNENEAVQYVDCIFVDLCGNARGKRIARADIEGTFRDGLPVPYTIYFLDARGDVVEPVVTRAAQRSVNGKAWPVPGSLTRVSWAQRPHGQVLMTLQTADGEPYFGEPRNVLRRVIGRFAAPAMVPTVSANLQFHLIERERTKEGLLNEPAEIDDAFAAAFRKDIIDAAETQGIVDLVLTQASRSSQFAIDLTARPDALAVADHLVFLRQIVRAVARVHKRDATFMARPFLKQAASGMRFQFSFPGASGDAMRQAVGGLQTVTAESLALFAPNPNAFRRLEGGGALPRNRRWGYLNKSANISIDPGSDDAPRLVLRSVSADANPYLVLAAILAGVHHGASRTIEPSPPTDGDVSALVDPTLPLSFDAALLALENGSIMREYLGPAYIDLYCATKRTELDRYRNFISAQEYDWYA